MKSTWNAANCSKGLELPDFGVAPFDIGFVQYLFGFGGINGYFPGMITQKLHRGYNLKRYTPLSILIPFLLQEYQGKTDTHQIQFFSPP